MPARFVNRLTLIVNPAAGRGGGRRAAAAAEESLRPQVGELHTHLTERPGHAAELAERYSEETDLVAVVGGDGTLSEVLTGLLRRGGSLPPVAILPAGTGNDFAAAVGIPRDPLAAARQLPKGTAQALDYGVLSPGEAPFVNIVGCGFDARVAAWLNRGRRLLGGRAAYVQGVLRELLALRSMPARLEVDDQRLEGDFLLIAIANGPTYGCGMRIAPRADLTDGLLDVVAVERVGRARFLRHFPRVFSGRHLDLPEVHVLRGRRVRLETAEPAPVLVDGDVRAVSPLEARVEPRGVKLWLPPDSPVRRRTA